MKHNYIITKETESRIHITQLNQFDPIPENAKQLDTKMVFELCCNNEEEWNETYRYPNSPYTIAFPPYERDGRVCGLIDATGGNIESYLTFYAENRKKQVILTYVPDTWESQIPE
jgi:hypothetical protein